MRDFIYDKYGYYIDEEYGKEFDYKGYHFCLEANTKSMQELVELNDFVHEIDDQLFNKGVYIIPSRNNDLAVLSEFGQLSLVAVKNFKVDLKMLTSLHLTYLQNNPMNFLSLTTIKSLWIEKIEKIETKIMTSLKMDDYVYHLFLSSTIYALGLGETAVQYLEDIKIDFGEKIHYVTITHKRLPRLTSYELLNPFNLIIDSPLRDIVELFKNGVIDENELINILKNYSLSAIDASYLLARLIYPSFLFDLLDDAYELKKDIQKDILKYYQKIDKEYNQLKYIHTYLINVYHIRPINWLID